MEREGAGCCRKIAIHRSAIGLYPEFSSITAP